MIKIQTKEIFSKQINNTIINKKCTVLEAIILICEEKNIEIESVTKLLTQDLIEKMEIECSEINLLKKNGNEKNTFKDSI